MTADAHQLARARRAVFGPPILGAIGAVLLVVGALGLDRTDSSASPDENTPTSEVQTPGTLIPAKRGYDVVTADAHMFRNGDIAANAVLVPNLPKGDRVVAATAAHVGGGGAAWLVTATGHVLDWGTPHYGGLPAGKPHATVVGIAATTDGAGYWIATADGNVVAFNAPSYPRASGAGRAAPIVGIAAAAGGGYWLADAKGNVYNFGPAKDFRKFGDAKFATRVVTIATANLGYMLLTADGALHGYATPVFGDLSKTGSHPDVVSVATSDDGGYWILTSDGSVQQFENALQGSSSDVVSLRTRAVAIIEI
ncbi:MAG TPA: hypothetical protein VFR41_08770 [Acidimicrobiia bacterium]|nr:hypothetical protein [Acidimicrobiia bacterium]